MGLSDKTIYGVAWTIAGEAIVKCISPFSFLILTRILSPTDFGVVAIATTVLSLIYIISDLGTSKVLVQLKCSDEDLNKYCDSSFWFNVIIGIILYVVILLFSESIAKYNNQPLATPIVRAMAIQVVFYSLSTVQTALMNRNMNYKSLFYIRLVTVGVPAILSIPIALLGGGVKAIVIGNVGGAFFSLIALWYYSNWKPSFHFKISFLKAILLKSLWSSFQQIAIWIPIAFDTYLLSNFLSAHDLGIYTTSRTLFISVSALIMSPILPVFFSALSKVDDDMKFRHITLVAQRTLFSIAVIVSLFVFIYSELLCNIIFTSKWDGISEIVRIIFVLMGFETFYSVIIEALRSKGMFKELAVNNMICTLLSLVLLYYAAQFGLWEYTLIRCLSLYICYYGVFYYSRTRLNISILDCLINNKMMILLGLEIFLADFLLDKLPIEVYYSIMTIIFLTMIVLFYFKEKKTILLVLSRFSIHKEKNI